MRQQEGQEQGGAGTGRLAETGSSLSMLVLIAATMMAGSPLALLVRRRRS